MRSRNSVVAALVVSAVTTGGVAAGAASPSDDATPMAPEACVSHHLEWSDAEVEAMTEAMQSGRVGDMASMMDDTMGSMGSMASMMGGSMGQMGWGR